MFVNLNKHGGNFRQVLDIEFQKSSNVIIASGYASSDVIQAFKNDFIQIAESGGIAKLLLGMAFYEGLGQKKLDLVNELNEALSQFNNNSGVYVTNGRRYHGKVYHFFEEDESRIYVGSSNFSSSGTKSNIECTVPIFQNEQKQQIINFLSDLYSEEYSITVDKAEITVPGKKKLILNNVESKWNSLKRYDPNIIDTTNLEFFQFPLSRVVNKEKSNLNTYFGKGRLNKKKGIITPRPWYEIELIATNDINELPEYPKGDFLAYTDDGFIIPMRTQGDYFKNIRSKNSLQIFGIWLKGKLERSGALNKYKPVTQDVLDDYGNSNLVFYKIKDGEYFLKF